MSKNKPLPVLPGLIDTHCHLEMEQFDADRNDAIKRAFDGGMEAMLTIASDVPSIDKALELANAHESIYCSVGLHPHDASQMDDALLEKISHMCALDKVVAVGETGLDYHYDNSPRDIQQEVFAQQLKLANSAGLPAIIHSRKATADTVRIIREAGLKKGVLHCFSGDNKLLELAIDMGLYISIAGPVTFKKATELQEAVVQIQDEFLLIETDSPYLAPVPMRGKRNEPSNVAYTAMEVARIRGVSPTDIARMTTLNARRLFGLPESSESTDTIAYKIRNSIYLNLTNRCTNRCTFCVRFISDYVKGHNLRLSHEPTADELLAAVGDPARYDEVVFCGYGEPTLRLDVLVDVARRVKERGGKVRLNTNGHGNVINKRNILPELKGLVDAISISLDAQDAATYEAVCKPNFDGAFEEVQGFILESKKYIPEVRATVVTASGVDVGQCKALADKLGVPLRVRELDIVG